ncbi:hypothetical protein PLESTB_001707900 [Pleodorina starrii]|uniref:Uncharacterized protein n=1 Tax=Pleodorina starrii TaxID=330485 RepID=A0A9W6C034_9CHLO|nr:hypothetical protein PLESTM_000919300 [Pleodorina starrii]GLC61025.1 hypothetical protein PLESTB_001707900 [Pleodorina starrii]
MGRHKKSTDARPLVELHLGPRGCPLLAQTGKSGRTCTGPGCDGASCHISEQPRRGLENKTLQNAFMMLRWRCAVPPAAALLAALGIPRRPVYSGPPPLLSDCCCVVEILDGQGGGCHHLHQQLPQLQPKPHDSGATAVGSGNAAATAHPNAPPARNVAASAASAAATKSPMHAPLLVDLYAMSAVGWEEGRVECSCDDVGAAAAGDWHPAQRAGAPGCGLLPWQSGPSSRRVPQL